MYFFPVSGIVIYVEGIPKLKICSAQPAARERSSLIRTIWPSIVLGWLAETANLQKWSWT